MHKQLRKMKLNFACILCALFLNKTAGSCGVSEETDFYCSDGAGRKFQTLCFLINVKMNVSCVYVLHEEIMDVTVSDLILSSIAQCGVKLVIHSAQSGNVSSEVDNISECVFISPQRNVSFLIETERPGEYTCGRRWNSLLRNERAENIVLYLTPPSQPVVRESNGMLTFARRQHFVVTTLPSLSWQNKMNGPNGTFFYSGINFEILNSLAEFLNFSYEIIEPDDGEYGSVDETGSWSGMINEILTKNADFGVADFTITKERSTAVDFMTPYWEEDSVFVVKLQDADSLMLYVNPFKTEVWLVIISTVILASLTMKWLEYSPNNWWGEHEAKDLDFDRNYLLNAFGHMVHIGSYQLPQMSSKRLFLSCYWILTITLIATYTGNLIAFMTVKKLKVPVNTLHELAESSFQAGVLHGSSHEGLFQSAAPGIVYKEIWDKNININRNNFYYDNYDDMVSAIRRAEKEDFVFICDFTFLYMHIVQEGICGVTLSKERFYRSNFGFPVSKDFPYKDVFNRGIDGILNAGFIQRWMKVYLPKSEVQCDTSLSSVGHTEATMKETVGAYIVLAVGMAAAALVLVFEITLKRIVQTVNFSDLKQDILKAAKAWRIIK